MNKEYESYQGFGVFNYVICAGLFGISALIGIYHAFFAKQKQNTASEYLLGGRRIGILPISLSMMASYVSGIAIVGIPAEIYTYGTQYWVVTVGELLTALVMCWAVIPVFYSLQITSSYEYLNRRFNHHVRTLASILFIFKMMVYIPIVMYLPASIFAQWSGFSIYAIIPISCAICTFYTTLGGLKAVVWTDTLQAISMILSIIFVIILGTINIGGFSKIWQESLAGERIDFLNMSWDPRMRYTFWSVLIGNFFQHMSVCTVNQAMVQRCLALPSLKKARIAIGLFALGLNTCVNLCTYCGLLIYATFYDCDPRLARQITKADHLFPYYVMKVAGHIPALPGIFFSGIFSAALSTMSTGLNSMSGIILEDFIKPLWKTPIPDDKSSFIMKSTTVLLGASVTILVFIVDKLEGILQATFSLIGITSGTLLGMFMLGMFLPWANTIGAVVGGSVATFVLAWVSVGHQLAVQRKQLIYQTKPLSTDGCSAYGINETIQAVSGKYPDEVPFLYRISYMYYTFIGTVTVLVVGMFVSYLTGFNDPKNVNPDVLSPVIQPFFKGKRKNRISQQKDEEVRSLDHSSQLQPFLKEESNVRRGRNTIHSSRGNSFLNTLLKPYQNLKLCLYLYRLVVEYLNAN